MKPKLLFIDDDPLMHALYKPHLERAGFEVISLLDGVEALEVASREQPVAMVVDMVLPGPDGLAIILVLKAAETTKKIPIIAISANLNLRDVRQQLEGVGVAAFLSKPFGAAKLVSEIIRLDQNSHGTVASQS